MIFSMALRTETPCFWDFLLVRDRVPWPQIVSDVFSVKEKMLNICSLVRQCNTFTS
jgi:hypothetical protein